MTFTPLESQRLLYRKFSHSDFPIVHDWSSNEENNRYRRTELSTEDDTRKHLQLVIDNAELETPEAYEYAVVIKATNQLIGMGCIFNISTEPELGWTLHRNHWQQGYGTEIGHTILKFGFETLNLRRIIAACNALNVASYKIMEKLEMRREAHNIKARRGNSTLGVEWCDRYQYAILREEYLK